MSTKEDIVKYVTTTPHNINPVILNQKLDEFSTGSGGSIQSDWLQNDETQVDYIKNRPFYEEVGEIDIFPEQETTYIDNPLYGGAVISINDIKDPCYELGLVSDPGTFEAVLVVNGEEIKGEIEYYYAPLQATFGEYRIDLDTGKIYPGENANLGDTYIVRMYATGVIIKTIDKKFIPDIDYVSYSNQQSLTDNQKYRARNNIGVGQAQAQGLSRLIYNNEITETQLILTDLNYNLKWDSIICFKVSFGNSDDLGSIFVYNWSNSDITREWKCIPVETNNGLDSVYVCIEIDNTENCIKLHKEKNDIRCYLDIVTQYIIGD